MADAVVDGLVAELEASRQAPLLLLVALFSTVCAAAAGFCLAGLGAVHFLRRTAAALRPPRRPHRRKLAKRRERAPPPEDASEHTDEEGVSRL